MWERACSRRGRSIQSLHRRLNRFREQARSHSGSRITPKGTERCLWHIYPRQTGIGRCHPTHTF
ncbi:hypothetical protein DKY63_19305 [Pseudomonas putida]|uniref:Uncharacterized protein n=1 Tax=Pseudomonas putida TaxID=303 RepID=A0A2Z4RLG9_PSEPU|nr:hypothetical protein DKY63_19305 [Pseudomonas putida]